MTKILTTVFLFLAGITSAIQAGEKIKFEDFKLTASSMPNLNQA